MSLDGDEDSKDEPANLTWWNELQIIRVWVGSPLLAPLLLLATFRQIKGLLEMENSCRRLNGPLSYSIRTIVGKLAKSS